MKFKYYKGFCMYYGKMWNGKIKMYAFNVNNILR